MKLNLVIEQGSTFDKTVFWETAPLVYKAITAISLAGPVRITAVGHGALAGQRAVCVGVVGSTQLNKTPPFKTADYRTVTVVSADVVEFNDLPGAGISAYKSGGYLVYHALKDLSGYTARMTLKNRIGGTTLLSLTSPSGIVLTTSIQILMTAVQTAALAASGGVYDLELVSAGGAVTRLLSGNFTVTPEATT